jgi:hypothetical protein
LGPPFRIVTILPRIEDSAALKIALVKQSEIDDSNSNIPNLSNVTNQISEIKLCENDVEDVLKVINPTKASGPVLINPRLLKEAVSIIKHPLCKLSNLSLRVASYPSQWFKLNSAHSFNLMRFAALVIIFSISTLCNYPIVVWSCD